MNHEVARTLLDAYLDGELALSDTLAVEAHLGGCDECRRWLEDRRTLVSRLRSAPVAYPMPAALERRIRAPVVAPARREFVATWPRALAASLLLACVGAWVGHSLPLRPDLGEALVAARVRSTLADHSIDVESSSHHTVRPWLSARLPFAPPVPEMAATGDALLGARVEYLERAPVAVLVYQHGNHRVEAFIWPTAAAIGPGPPARTIEGFHLVATGVAGFNAVFVSDMATAELAAFRDRWRAQAGSIE